MARRGRRLADLLVEVRACTVCVEHLPLGPKPTLQAGPGARVAVIGQAPGRLAHISGTPWDDPSGDRLREWMGLERGQFYDPDRVALVPMGFCFPGTGSGGDLPPRPECAPLWHHRIFGLLADVGLTLVIGAYAQARYLPDSTGSVTAIVQGWRDRWPELCPLPHPSPRNNRWIRQRPWFEAEVVPAVRARVAELVG